MVGLTQHTTGSNHLLTPNPASIFLKPQQCQAAEYHIKNITGPTVWQKVVQSTVHQHQSAVLYLFVYVWKSLLKEKRNVVTVLVKNILLESQAMSGRRFFTMTVYCQKIGFLNADCQSHQSAELCKGKLRMNYHVCKF